MPNVKGNPAQVMKDQMGLIAANPIASIAKMAMGAMLGGVFHSGLGNMFQNTGNNNAGNALGNIASAAVGGIGSIGGAGGTFNGPGGFGGYNGGGFQASSGGFGNYGSDGGFNSGMQSSSGFTYDR